MSIDGYITGPNNEQDWMVFFGDEKLKEYEFRLLESVETILLGRKMTNEFISYWTEVLNKPNDSWYAFAKKLIETPKIVFTKTLTKSEWPNTELATGDLNEEITKLKSQEGSGGDIIVYGGASFDSSLIKAGLIDEFHLFVNPAAIGNGMTIFKDLNEMQKFTLVKSIAFDCGIVALHYEPKRA